MKYQHIPLFREHPESKSLVVFIHGYMGSPRQFAGLIDLAYEHGHSIAALLLPGHGGSAKYFGTGSYEAWQSHVDSEVERFSHDYSSILLVGHSMGGLLAINTAVKFDKCVRGLFLIATPFKRTLFSMYALKLRLKQAFSRRDNPLKREYLDNCSVALTPDFIWTNIKPAADIKRLMNAARIMLPKLTVPVTAVYSSGDELVAMESADILKNELNDVDAPLTLVLLSDSTHVYYPPHEQAIIERSFEAALSVLQ